LVFMVLMKFSTVSAHTRHGVPTRGKRAQVPGTLPWWVRDCGVGGSRGTKEFQSPPSPQAKLTFVGMSGLLLNLIITSDGADWTLAATSALPSTLKFEGQSGVLSQQRPQLR